MKIDNRKLVPHMKFGGFSAECGPRDKGTPSWHWTTELVQSVIKKPLATCNETDTFWFYLISVLRPFNTF